MVKKYVKIFCFLNIYLYICIVSSLTEWLINKINGGLAEWTIAAVLFFKSSAPRETLDVEPP